MSKKESPSTLVVGVGTAGCRIAEYMRSSGFSAEYAFASFDKRDVPDGNPRFDWKSSEGSEGFDYIAELSSASDFVIMIGNAGGKSGSYFMPKISRIARNEGRPVLAVVLYPLLKEKWLEYSAGTCISKLKKTRCGLLTVDMEQILDSVTSEMPIEHVYQSMNEKIAFMLMGLLTKSDEVSSVLCRGNSIMELADFGSSFDKTVADAIRSTLKTGAQEIDEVYIISAGNRPITFEDSDLATSGIRNIIAPSSKVHFVNYRTERAGFQSLVAMVGHMEGTISSRIFDPIEAVIGNKWLDYEPELGIHIPLDIERID